MIFSLDVCDPSPFFLHGIFFITVASQSAKIKKNKKVTLCSLYPRFFVYISHFTVILNTFTCSIYLHCQGSIQVCWLRPLASESDRTVHHNLSLTN